MKKLSFTPRLGTTYLALMALAVFAGAVAQAQVVIFTENFNNGSLTTPGATLGSYSFGDTTGVSSGIVPGVGVGGSGGWQTVNTVQVTTNSVQGYSGVGAAYQDRQATGNTSANLSDYTLSFDAMATSGSLDIKVQSWSGADFGGTMTGNLDTTATVPPEDNLPLSSTYQSYSLNLGDTSIFHSNSGLVMTDPTLQIIFQLNNTGTPPYSSIMGIDNIKLVMVPEPGSFAFCGLDLAAGIWLIRRRRTLVVGNS